MMLLNGNKQARVRSSEDCTVLDCGCAHTDTRWLQMCDAHYAEDNALHVAAQQRTFHELAGIEHAKDSDTDT